MDAISLRGPLRECYNYQDTDLRTLCSFFLPDPWFETFSHLRESSALDPEGSTLRKKGERASDPQS